MPLPGPMDVTWRMTVSPGAARELYQAGETVTSAEVRVKNTHETESVYIGGAGVTPGNGYELPAGETEAFNFRPSQGQKLFISVAGNPVIVHCARGQE